ncbi:hypothetical protein [Desertivirga brevis]|uniref:hypothetical protein n=1 Tax=Desertivirga brevis TaxID=2810310 RepID=UPI001A962EC5|nr:hypothetical protein [Pedobacter sp. SYSU D00873]
MEVFLVQHLEQPSEVSEVLGSLILGLDSAAHILWRLFSASFIALLIYIYWQQFRGCGKWFCSERVFLLLSAACLLLLRFPIYAASEINPDEAEWIAGAATLLRDPRFWISVDGTTSGPLNIYPLCLIGLLNIPLSYASVRIFLMLALVIPTFYFNYLSLKLFFSRTVAQTVILPFLIFFSLTSHYDLSFYSSEYVSVLLISIVIFLYATYSKSPSFLLLSAAGFILGLLPYAKFQSLPIGFILGVFFITNILFEGTLAPRKKVLKVLALCFFALIPSVIVLAYLFSFNAYVHFWESYIVNNLIYGGKVSVRDTLLGLPKIILLYSKDTLGYYITAAIIPIVGAIVLLKKKHLILNRHIRFLLFSHLLFLATYYAIGKGWGFPHYQIFVFTPIILINAFYLNIILSQSNNVRLSNTVTAFLIILSASMIIPDNAIVSKILAEKEPGPHDIISKRISNYSKPGDKLLVYGFQDILNSNGTYYLQTGMTQATKESHSQRPEGFLGSPEQVKYYQKRYLDDIRANKPRAIIDLTKEDTSSNFYPSLRAYVITNYFLDTIAYRNIGGRNAASTRTIKLKRVPTKIYIRKESSQLLSGK